MPQSRSEANPDKSQPAHPETEVDPVRRDAALARLERAFGRFGQDPLMQKLYALARERAEAGLLNG